ncbi:phasin family protein [Sphingobium yanoikuyae]|uniref:phasin family protein n=1 Tax=Sphingobium yanoikuyae TaxID=13690 RepID=UPI0004E3D340|nr:phasin family protein [Sphingobium yanoikuyae]KFD27426.1 hypothetical protein IH86_14990 [Sphingobium yanoikuyae]MDV3480073.1 phasin family protein [Sphingobium yanoikuyae]
MDQPKPTSAEWLAGNMRETVGAGAERIKETSQAALETSRAVVEISAEVASALRDQVHHTATIGVAVVEAGLDAHLDHLNNLASARSFQDFIRLQMTWAPNQALTMFRALKKADAAAEPYGPSDKRQD